MDKSLILGRIIGLLLFIFSLVLLLNKSALKAMIRLLRTKEFLLITGFVFLCAGIVVITIHNIWELSWRGVVTITGWLFLLEGLFRLIFMDTTVKIIREMKSPTPVIMSLYLTLILGAYLTITTFLK